MPGFPQGLRPPNWMGDLVEKKLNPELARTISPTWFVFPGSHDAATYADGLADFSYQCQEKTMYEQMMTGNRSFDLRLAPADENKPGKFIPVHGIAKNTADDFNQTPKEANQKDLARQIFRFAREHPSEILVIKIKFDGMNAEAQQRAFADTAWHLLGERLLKAPENEQTHPTYKQAVENNKNIILATGLPVPKGHPIADYYWIVGGATKHWMGDGNEMLWNEPTWQSGDLKKVLRSTEDYIEKNQEKLRQRDKFWVAYLQLTPVLGQSITTFFKEGGSIRPRDLALGGGIGTHGSFKGSNKELRESGALRRGVWKKHASCIMYDFCDEDTTGDIVAMNISGGDGDERHEAGPGAGRPGGQHDGGHEEGGGRGGRHEGGDERHEGEREHEGGGGGRGGGHRGGRGRGHD